MFKRQSNLIGKYRHDGRVGNRRKRGPELGSTGQAHIDGDQGVVLPPPAAMPNQSRERRFDMLPDRGKE